MTLTLAAQKILTGAQSGVPDSLDAPLRELNALLSGTFTNADLCTAIKIMNEAREAVYAQRHRIVLNLQQLERSALYGYTSPRASTSWQISG